MDAGRRDVRVSEPLLHLGDVGLVVERVGGGCRAEGVRADRKPELRRVGPHELVNAVGRDRLIEPPGRVVANGPEQRAAVILAVAGRLEIFVDQGVRARMQRQIARLAAFAL